MYPAQIIDIEDLEGISQDVHPSLPGSSNCGILIQQGEDE